MTNACVQIGELCVGVYVRVCFVFTPSTSFEQYILSAKPGNKISNEYRFTYALHKQNAYEDNILMLKEEESG